MRLVGATDAYIRRPFLIEGFAKGVLGGLLALLLTWVAQHADQPLRHPDDLLRRARRAARTAVRRADRAARAAPSRSGGTYAACERRAWRCSLLARSRAARSRRRCRARSRADARIRAQREELDRIRRERADARAADGEPAGQRARPARGGGEPRPAARGDGARDPDARPPARGDHDRRGRDDDAHGDGGARARRRGARRSQRRLVDIYKRGPLYSAEALLTARSFGELVARYKYLHEIAVHDRALVTRVRVAARRDRAAARASS